MNQAKQAPRLAPLARDIRLAAWPSAALLAKRMACHERAAANLFAAASRMEAPGIEPGARNGRFRRAAENAR